LKILVSQKGAREHYAVVRSLHQQGLLAGLVTDWYAFGGKSRKQKAARRSSQPKTSRAGESRNEEGEIRSQKTKIYFSFQLSIFQLFGGRGQSALAARSEGIPDGLVRAFPFRSLLWKWRVRRLAAQGRLYEAYAQTDAAFAAAVARLKLPPHDVFFGYSYASLETLEAEKKRGVLTVLDQIDPGAMEFRLVAEEMQRHLELAGPPPTFPAAYYERNRREWELADIIVVNSKWSREALVTEGINPAKIEILPLAYEVAQSAQEKAESRKQKAENKNQFQLSTSRQSEAAAEDFSVSAFSPLRVLFLGQVNVRKGIHYLMAAARLLEREKIHFDVVGSVGILPGAVASAPRNMTFHGSVSRDRAAEWYRQSDVFVLPTLSDGFALTQLEALAHGLPVIVTPNCGRVVEEGKTGFVVLACDAQALAEAIMRFARNRALSSEMSPKCREAAAGFSIDAYGQHLVEIINGYRAK
jgi:glycosyltransferase involved in cell wall biosynthesis